VCYVLKNYNNDIFKLSTQQHVTLESFVNKCFPRSLRDVSTRTKSMITNDEGVEKKKKKKNHIHKRLKFRAQRKTIESA